MRKSGPMFVPRASKDGLPVQGLAFMHYCAEPTCPDWGSFGVGASMLKNEPGKWYCRAHLPPQET